MKISLFNIGATIESRGSLRGAIKDLIISSGLSDIEKQVLLHRYYNTRLTLEKIGVKLGYSLSTIREAEYRGIKKLKEYYHIERGKYYD